jgi:serine/threonine protein kinase
MPQISPSLEEILAEAVEMTSPEDRRAFVHRACGDNTELKLKVEQLIDNHFRAGSFLDCADLAVAATIAPAVAERPGALIGPYKLLEQIGEGGMGLVYMAEQQRPVKRLVALKLIKPGMDSKQVIARFEAERQALALMDHSNIAKVLDAGTTAPTDGGYPGRPYFVMELVRGIPLSEFCDEKRLEVRERIELFIQVCQGVQHAHQKGIIHRDLKPTNILVSMHDSVAVPKIIDFGIAKALGQSLTDHTLHTGYSQLVGTPLYMSPEQAEMNQFGVDTRSDVYSLGVMLYELLTGTTPFDKETLTKVGFDEMRRIIREQDPPRPSARLSTLKAEALSTVSNRRRIDPRRITTSLRGELDWIVMKALSKERSERYESASSLARDIARYLAGDLVQACPPSPYYRFRKFARRNKTAFTTTALLAASLLLGTTISLWQAIRATAAEAQANANAAQAEANEGKAKAQEQKALAAVEAERSARKDEAEQRQQAQKNLEAALDAVDRMLTHLNDEELNDVPRIGPLRRRILRDTVGFYQRIPLNSAAPAQLRDRIAGTWHRIGEFARDMNSADDAIPAYRSAIELLDRLVAEQPSRQAYRGKLGRVHHDMGWLYLYEVHDLAAAINAFDHSVRTLAIQPNIDRGTSASSLNGRGIALGGLKKRDEAMESFRNSLDLLDRSKPHELQQYAATLNQMANLEASYDEARAIDLYRRSIDEYRKSSAAAKNSPVHGRGVFSSLLDDAAVIIAKHNKDEGEKLWDESIAIRQTAYADSPQLRTQLFMLIRAQSRYAAHAQRSALSGKDATTAAREQAKGNALFQEALANQRQLVTKFGLVDDRYALVRMLNEESGRILRAKTRSPITDGNPSAASLQADALLTEAIQLCRALAAEFPDNSDYKSRLAELEKLRVQHFSEAKPNPNP